MVSNNDMYQLGKRMRHHRRLRHMVVAVLFALLAVSCYTLLHLQTKPTGTIHNAPIHSASYTVAPAKQPIDEPLLSFDLPAGWGAFKLATDFQPPTYSYRSGGQHTQLLSIYMDAIPATLAVNRVVVVTAQGNQLTYGDVSDNCASFTRPSKANPGSGVASGVWQGNSFICDLGNYERDVVGITSTNGVNMVRLTSQTSGTHQLFLTYTDNDVRPDFSTLYSILSSLKLK